MDDSAASIFAAFVCAGLWGLMAAAAGGLGHLRMLRVERALGHRAEPSSETVQLVYAGAATVWVAAAALALVGLAHRDWARTGRNCLFIFLGHFTLIAALVPVIMPVDDTVGPAAVVPVLVLACSIVAVSALAATIFAARWVLFRARRLEAMPPTGTEAPGAVRFLVYFGSLLAWPVGLVGALVYNKPENARVGAVCLVFSLVNTLGVAWSVCIALPLLAHALL